MFLSSVKCGSTDLQCILGAFTSVCVKRAVASHCSLLSPSGSLFQHHFIKHSALRDVENASGPRQSELQKVRTRKDVWNYSPPSLCASGRVCTRV